MKRTMYMYALGAAIALSGAGSMTAAAKPAARLTDIAVNLWFGNADADGLESDGLQVVANGVTADYIDGLQNVLAIIQSSGDFRFSTQNNTRQAPQRCMYVDFRGQYAGPLPYGDGSGRQCVNATEPMHAYSTGDVAIQQLVYGQSVQKLVRLGWDDGGYVYRLGYGTDMDQNGVIDSPSVTVTCIAPQDPTRPCTKWILSPPSPGTAAFFRFRLLNGGNEGPAEFLGNYTMPFSQTFSLK